MLKGGPRRVDPSRVNDPNPTRSPSPIPASPAPHFSPAPVRKGRAALWVDAGRLPLALALPVLHHGRCTGRLDFSYAGEKKRVWLREGEVVFATSTATADRLGECLLRAGRLDLSQLEEAERVHRPPARFGRALVSCGFLTPHQLWNAVRHQVEEIVRSLFCFGAGTASFRVDVAEPDNVVRLALDTGRLIEEGEARRREIQAFLDVLRHPGARLLPGHGFQGALAAEERRLHEALGAGASFARLVEQLGSPEESLARSIQLLRLVGAVRLRLDAAKPAEPDGAQVFSGELAAQCKRIRALTDALGEPEAGKRASWVARLDPFFTELTRRYSAIAAADRPSGDELETWVARLLALPGGEEQAPEILEEMASYLEFEIRNDPAISEPDRLLQALSLPAC